MLDMFTELVISITRKGWLPRHERHPWDSVEYVLFLFRYPRWLFRFFLWVDPPYRKGDPWKTLSLDQWSKYVDVYFGLERPSAEQHLSSRRIVQRKMSEWVYLVCLTLITILCWGVIAWQQQLTVPVRHLWPLEWILIQYLLPPFAFAIDWAKYRTKYWQFDLRETHGTARWKRFDELKNKRYIVPRGTKVPGHAYLAPYNSIYDLIFPFEEMFRSRLFVGKPGSGKSSTFHANHLRFYARDFNAVAVDIKGELYQQAAHYYDRVYRLDFRDPCYSDRFNLIRDCRGDITFTSKIAFTLIVTSNKEAASSQNKYFYDSAKAVLTALILHLAEDSEHYPEATLNDLFYVLAGEYRTPTEYDRQYYTNRVIEWLEAEDLFGFLFRIGGNSQPPPNTSQLEPFIKSEEARIAYLRKRIRTTLLSSESIQSKTLYLLYTFENECYRMLKNSRHPGFERFLSGKNLYEKTGIFAANSRWGKALSKLQSQNRKVENYEINWEKEFPRILEYVDPEPNISPGGSKNLSVNLADINKLLSSPEKSFEKIYHMLSSLSPTRPDYREMKRSGNGAAEYREEGYFLDKESGRVSVFLTQMFRTSPSLPARQSWASFQSSAGNDPRLLGNITSTLLTAIECFRDPTVNLCFRNPTPEEKARGCRIVDWSFLRGETPTALFLVMSAAQSIQLAPIVATIFSVIMEKLLRELNDPTGEKKLKPCYLQVDEGGNFKIPNIAEFVATCRGSAVCVDYSVQSVLQLNHLYGNDYGEMVKEVFGTKIFLPGSEGKTAELVAHLGGELTTRQRKIVDLPGRWLDREEDQEVKRHLIDGYEARTLARHLEALCLMSDEPAVRITFPPFARDLDSRLSEPPRFADDNITDVRTDLSVLSPEHLREEVGSIIESVFKKQGEGQSGEQGRPEDEPDGADAPALNGAAMEGAVMGGGMRPADASGVAAQVSAKVSEASVRSVQAGWSGQVSQNIGGQATTGARPMPTVTRAPHKAATESFAAGQKEAGNLFGKEVPPPVPSAVNVSAPPPPDMNATGTGPTGTNPGSPYQEPKMKIKEQSPPAPVPAMVAMNPVCCEITDDDDE